MPAGSTSTMPYVPLSVTAESKPSVDQLPPTWAVPNPGPARLKSSAAIVEVSYCVDSVELSAVPSAA